MHIHSYPKVYAIGHGAIAELFDGPVLVEEKVDGSQFSFCRVGSEVFFRSRGADVIPGAHDAGMFAAGVNAIKEIADSLTEGWVYRCEYLSKPKHNTLVYSRVPKRHCIIFDINTGDEIYLSRHEKVTEAERIGLEYVPLMYEGTVDSPEKIHALLDTESILGGKKVEGIVAKNYARFGKDKKVMMGKFVSEEFKETHGKEWKASNPALTDVVERIIATLKNPVRWEKAVNRLRDAGTLEGSPRDIGNLIAEVQRDIRDEEREFIQQKLTEWALPRVIRASTGGLPEWYKERLLQSAFAGKDADENKVDATSGS